MPEEDPGNGAGSQPAEPRPFYLGQITPKGLRFEARNEQGDVESVEIDVLDLVRHAVENPVPLLLFTMGSHLNGLQQQMAALVALVARAQQRAAADPVAIMQQLAKATGIKLPGHG